jgi:hypothetical protein
MPAPMQAHFWAESPQIKLWHECQTISCSSASINGYVTCLTFPELNKWPFWQKSSFQFHKILKNGHCSRKVLEKWIIPTFYPMHIHWHLGSQCGSQVGHFVQE